MASSRAEGSPPAPLPQKNPLPHISNVLVGAGSAREEAGEASQTRSIANANPCPTPTHIVASPRLPPLFSN